MNDSVGFLAFLVVVAIGFCGLVGWGGYRQFLVGSESWRRYRRLVDTPQTKIGFLDAGFFEVQGRVLPPQAPLQSPMGHVSCVYYRFVARERRTKVKWKNGKFKSKTEWIVVIDDEADTRCIISDGSGRVQVPVRSAELHLRMATRRTGFLRSPPPDLLQTLEDNRVKSVGWLFNKAMRFEETVVAINQEVYVAGDVKQTPGGPAFGHAHSVDDVLLVTDRGETHLRRRSRGDAIVAGLVVVLSILVIIAAVAGLLVLGVMLRSQ